MMLATTESGNSQRNKEILNIGSIIVFVIVLSVITYAFLPGLFGATVTVNSDWVAGFVNDINSARATHNQSLLITEDNLTLFAESRAAYGIAHYQSVDYGAFKNASLAFFGRSVVVTEVVVYPDGYTPSNYLNYLKQDGPRVYQDFLMNSTYGYAITVGPYYVPTNTGCKAYSIPPNTENITQYLESQGCQFKIENVTWLVFEMSK